MNKLPTYEEFLNESINTKDIKVGTILNFKDGETWKVVQHPGISSNSKSIWAVPYKETKKRYVSIAIQFTVKDLENGVKSLSESAVNEASAFKTSDISKTVAFLNAEVGDRPGYIFFGYGEDIEDFDKLWKKRKYQEALDMLANDREIVATTFDDVKPWVKESVNESSSLDKGGDYWNQYISNKDTEVKNIRGTRKVKVPVGTVISAAGGGYWVTVDRSIETGIDSLQGNPDFDVVNNSTWPKTIELNKEIENWARDTSRLIQRHPKEAQAVINHRSIVIENIRKLLK